LSAIFPVELNGNWLAQQTNKTMNAVADPGGGGHGPPVGGLKFFCQYINIITKHAYDGPWEY